LIKRIDAYKLQSNWAHYLREEKKNPDICLFSLTFYDDVHEMTLSLLHDLASASFYDSELFNQYLQLEIDLNSVDTTSVRQDLYVEFD
jgi:hypothetical protein